jgi:hypothetical protein
MAVAMHVAVLEFFCTGFAHILHRDGEMEALASERMVGVDLYFIVRDAHDRHDPDAVFFLGLELHAYLDLLGFGEIFLGHREDQFFVPLAVGFYRCDDAVDGIAGFFAFEVLLEACDDVFVAVKVYERLAVGLVDKDASTVLEHVIDRYNTILLDIHVGLPLGRDVCAEGRDRTERS